MARRKRHEEHENHERWLVSYADFITLLFAFFVVMYSISSINEGKYRVLSETLETVFAEPTRSLKPIQVGDINRGQGKEKTQPASPAVPSYDIDLPQIPKHTPPPADKPGSLENINKISRQLTGALSKMIKNDDVIIKKGDDWLEVEIKSRVLFHSGEATLEKNAVPVIGKVADILSSSSNPIQVEGFTDNNPINTPRFPSNWELSAARAASVVHLLDRYGINPSRMSATGYGQYKPIADNSTEEGRQKNRRVVLVVLGNQNSRRSLSIFNPDANQTITPDTSGKPSSTLQAPSPATTNPTPAAPDIDSTPTVNTPTSNNKIELPPIPHITGVQKQ